MRTDVRVLITSPTQNVLHSALYYVPGICIAKAVLIVLLAIANAAHFLPLLV